MAKWWEDSTLYQTSKPAAVQNSGGKWWDDQSLYQPADTSSPIKQKIARSLLNAESGSKGYDESLIKQRESSLDPRINYNAIDPLNIREDGEAAARYISVRDNIPLGQAQDNTDYFGLNFKGNIDVAKNLGDRLGVKGRRSSETLSQIHQRYYPDLAPDRFASLVGLTPKTEQEKEADLGLTPRNGLGWWESTKEAFKSGAAAPVAGVVRAYADLTGNDEMAANSEAALRGISQGLKDAKQGKGKLGSLAISAVNSAPLMIATMATGGLGASAAGATALGTGAMFAGSAAQKYGQNRAEGYEVGDSASNAAITGAIEAGTELLPFAKALKPVGKSALAQLTRAGKTAGLEGVSEAYATVGEALADKATLGKDIDARKLASDIVESAATGGLVGGILAGPSTIKDITRKTNTNDTSADLGAELVKNAIQEKKAKEFEVKSLEKADAEEKAALEKLLVEKAQLEFDQRAKQELDAARASAGRLDVGLGAGRAEQIAAEIASNYGVTPESILRNDLSAPQPIQQPTTKQSALRDAQDQAQDLPTIESPSATEIQQAAASAMPQRSIHGNMAQGRIDPTISSFDVVPRETPESLFNSVNDTRTLPDQSSQIGEPNSSKEFIESTIPEVQNARIPRGSFRNVDEAKVAARQAWGKAVDRLERNGVLSFISTDELASLAPDAIKSADSVNRVKGVYINGKAHIVADQVKAEELPGVILHEVGVHHGFKGMVGDEKFTEIKTSLQGLKEKNKDVQAAYAAVPKDTPEDLVDEEALAYLIENKPGHGVVRRAMDAVIGFLNKLGFPMSKLEGDVAGLRRMARESLRQSSKQTAPVAAQSAAPQEVAAAQDQNMQDLGNAWVELGKSDKLYKYPKANERDASLEDFVKTVAPDIQVEKVYDEDGESAYNLTSSDGKPGTLVIEPDGTMQLDINKFEEGKSGGGRLYSALYQFAEKNGLKAAPDRAGLSKVNEYRRTEHMLSSAIKKGNTAHLQPDQTQGLPNWRPGKTKEENAANIGEMAYKSMQNVTSSVPSMKGVRYNFKTNNFEDASGREVTDEDFDRIAESEQAREIGAGRTTLKRAAWTSSFLQGKGGADGGQLLARSSREQLERVPTGTAEPRLKGIAYSRSIEPSKATVLNRESTFSRPSSKEEPSQPKKAPEPKIAEARKQAQVNREFLKEQLDAGNPVQWEMKNSEWTGWRAKGRDLRRKIQDRMIVFRDVQQDIQEQRGVLEDAMNFYRRENLMSGRVGHRTDLFERNHVKPLYEAMKEADIKPEILEEYLQAKHAQERNEAVAKRNPNMKDAGSGLTTNQAKEVLNKFDPKQTRELERLSSMVYNITEATRKNLLDSGVISQAQYDAMGSAYKYYVPLRGKDGVEAGSGTGRGLDISRGSGVKRALGRGEGNYAKNILAEVFADQVRSIQTMEKARVMKTVMRLALENKNPDLWEVEPVKTETKYSDAAGQAYEAVANLRNEDGMLLVPFNGKRYQLLFKDQRLADAYKNLSAEQFGWVMKLGSGINRYLSAMFTRYNPSFVAVNMTRDAIFGTTAIAAEHGAKAAWFVTKNYAKAAKGLWDYSRGKENTEWSKYAKDYSEDGGKTIFQNSQTVENLAKGIQDEFKSIGELIKEKRPVKAVQKAFNNSTIVQQIERANDVIENSMRLSAYVALRNKGQSREQAAEYAKNFTVNFNRRGQSTSVLNALYLFFNASMQGGHRTLSLMKNKKVLASMGALAGVQAVLAAYAMSLKDDDEENAWDKIPEWDKLKNLVIPYRTDDGKIDYFKIPMPYGFNLFSYGGGRIAKFVHDIKNNQTSAGKSSLDFTKDMMSGAAQAFSPLPFEQKGWRSALPYYVNVGLDISENRDGMGMPIRNDYLNEGDPRIRNSKPGTNEAFKVAAKALNRFGGGDDVTKPEAAALLDWAPEDLEYLTKTFTGGLGSTVIKSGTMARKLIGGVPLKPNDVPIVSSFLSEVDENRVVSTQFYDISDEIERDVKRIRDAGERGDNPRDAVKYLDPSSFDYRTTKKNGQALESPRTEARPGSLLHIYRNVNRDLDDINQEISSTKLNDRLGYAEQQKEIERLQKERGSIQQRLITAWKRETKRKRVN